MGNSGSGHHSYKTPPSQMQQYVQSLPREGRGGSSSATAQKYYNGGFKVLPERVPGQKLRLTDNGNLLQNGGTLSGRRLLGAEPAEPDPEFMRMLKRRSEVIEGSLDDHDDRMSDIGQQTKVDGSLRKKYHSNPDLLNSHGIISGNPSGSEAKKKKLQKKSKAPPPPHHYSEDEMTASHYYAQNGSSPVKDKKRHFPNFLKPSSKKGHDTKSKLPPSERQDFNNIGNRRTQSRSPTGPPLNINAEITSAKLNSRDKSVTYVLERRDHHSGSSSMLNVGGGHIQIPSDNPDGPNIDRRYMKRSQSPDGSSKPPASTNSLYHPHLQAKLSDGGLHAMSIDRSEIRNRAYELQKRVRSMDSLACSSDDREIYFNNQRSSPFRSHLQERIVTPSKETNKLLDNDKSSHNVALRRHPSNNSSLASQGKPEKLPWQKAQSRTNLTAERPASMPYPNGDSPMQDSVSSPSKKDLLNRSDSSNRKAFYYGSEQRNLSMGQNKARESFPGSLDRQGSGVDARTIRQWTPSGNTQSTGNLRASADDGGHRMSTNELNKNSTQQHSYNRNLDHFSKDKLRPMNSKEILGKEVREDNLAVKGGKDYHDKDLIPDHLQEAFFAKTKETRAGVIEYNQKLASGRHRRDNVPPKTNGGDGDLSSEDEMDINMQLRPTLPKRLPAMPRFSPTQVWRSFSLDDSGIADKSSDRSSDGEEGDVFEDRIQRIARPVAPPRSNNEKSADSGISPGAVSPIQAFYDFDAVVVPEKSSTTSNPPPQPLLTTRHSSSQQHLLTCPPAPISPLAAKGGLQGSSGNLRTTQNYDSVNAEKKPQWTPEEDLASDFDAGSTEHAIPSPAWKATAPEMISTQPKLTSRKEMFVSRRSPNGISMEKDAKSDYSDTEMKNGKSTKKPKGGKNGEPNSPQKYNSIRKLKRSLSGVLQGHGRGRNGEENHRSLDDNWSLSRSLPNSLHNGHDGEIPESKALKSNHNPKNEISETRLPRSESGPIYSAHRHESDVEQQPFIDLEGQAFSRERAQSATSIGSSGMRYNRNGHIVYLPKYEAMEIITENDPLGGERRAYSDLGTGVKESNVNHNHFPFKKPKKFTYQSTVRQIERKQLEQKLSQEVAVKEMQREREMDLVNKVEEEFQKKRDKERDDIQQQLRILSLESNQNEDLPNGGYLESTRSLPREYPIYEDSNRYNHSSVTSHQENGSTERHARNHMSLPTLVIPPEDYDMTLPRERTKNKLGSLPGKNSREPTMSSSNKSAATKVKKGASNVAPPAESSSGFFSGIGKWMRRQQRLEKHGNSGPSRQEPEGAPSSFGTNGAPPYDNPHSSSGQSLQSHSPSSPNHHSRHTALTGAKYSSGRIPDGQSYLKASPITPQQRKNIYTHLAEVAEKEELRKHHQENSRGEKDARTSVWISQDTKTNNTKVIPGLSKNNNIGGNDFYQVPYDSLGNGKMESRYAPNMRHNFSKNQIIDKDNYGRLHNSLQKERNANQRHSIAIDPSTDHWTGGLIPPPQGYEDKRPNVDSKHRGSSILSTPNNEASSGNVSWNQGVSRQDSYRESLEGSSTDNRRQYVELPVLNVHHRSLSFTHLWEGEVSNSRKPETTSPRHAVPPVQPFSPNKGYRPVAFQARQHGPSK